MRRLTVAVIGSGQTDMLDETKFDVWYVDDVTKLGGVDLQGYIIAREASSFERSFLASRVRWLKGREG